MIRVVAAPPYLTVQDDGREGHRAAGVAPSGSADADTAHMLNRMVGNAAGAAVLEWAVAGGALRFNGPATVAVGGAAVEATLDGTPLIPNAAQAIRGGAELRVLRFLRGRFLYVAIAGGVDVPLVLGSRSTLAAAALGGHEGRRVRTGDMLPVGAATPFAVQPGATIPRAPFDTEPIIVTPGPHLARVGGDALAGLVGLTWRVSRASDRTGYRLEGREPLPGGSGGTLSEPTCVGAVQLPPDGWPVVLMHDGPTVGGYPIVAVVATRSLGRFAQRAPGDAVRFALAE